ncbi:hypothetical protein DV515_00009213 [Chloebia gouldiae]|uniref:Uncharacterized protein n=1 Tax=Chloebia gouldiae TaxID=44316 RepID=A0A3L8SE00_CHLGU|nr:hypothetical protein DV515_00009213 [Chloebia gouldiae]
MEQDGHGCTAEAVIPKLLWAIFVCKGETQKEMWRSVGEEQRTNLEEWAATGTSFTSWRCILLQHGSSLGYPIACRVCVNSTSIKAGMMQELKIETKHTPCWKKRRKGLSEMSAELTMCGLDMEAVPPGPVAGGWSMKSDTGISKTVCDILREMLKLLASKQGLICLA